MSLLETSDIRSAMEQNITPEIALRIGQTIGLQYKDVTLGTDVNPSSETLKNALVSGLTSAGSKVRLAGRAPAAAVAFSSSRSECSIMLGDPDQFGVYSGISLRNSDGSAFNEDQMRQVRIRYESSELDLPSYKASGIAIPVDGVIEKYRRKVSELAGKTDCPVILDCGCGVTSAVAPQIFVDMGSDLVAINAYMDGRYPVRSPSVEESELKQLIHEVKTNSGSIGIAFNGDGTELAVIDELGRYVNHDQVLALLVHHLNPESIVVPMNSSALIDDMFDGKVHRTSDAKLCDSMKKTGIRFGGGTDGSFIFSDISYCPDGIFAATAIAKLAEENSIRKLVDDFPQYTMDHTRVVFDGNREQFSKRIAEALQSLDHNDLVEGDGWRLEMDSGWFLIRFEGNEPYIDVTAEGRDKAYLVGLLEIAKDTISAATRP
ncbi:MAG: hypothetical protein RBQ77_04785 [Candidatus Methanomethylophilaceae archaeon]|jgi:phosphoglucosamine mutase|nr:hypothetical protein [Candidatus Methanomethylophilaceae archaeon]NLF33902.1 hypothetical protein [Thermoplasmatales archaeon]